MIFREAGGNQLLRASTSIVLNLAEGAGEFSPREKARFYRLSRRSGTECAAILDVCRKLRLLAIERYMSGREDLLRVVSMLVRMIRNAEESGRGTGTKRNWAATETR